MTLDSPHKTAIDFMHEEVGKVDESQNLSSNSHDGPQTSALSVADYVPMHFILG